MQALSCFPSICIVSFCTADCEDTKFYKEALTMVHNYVYGEDVHKLGKDFEDDPCAKHLKKVYTTCQASMSPAEVRTQLNSSVTPLA